MLVLVLIFSFMDQKTKLWIILCYTLSYNGEERVSTFSAISNVLTIILLYNLQLYEFIFIFIFWQNYFTIHLV